MTYIHILSFFSNSMRSSSHFFPRWPEPSEPPTTRLLTSESSCTIFCKQSARPTSARFFFPPAPQLPLETMRCSKNAGVANCTGSFGDDTCPQSHLQPLQRLPVSLLWPAQRSTPKEPSSSVAPRPSSKARSSPRKRAAMASEVTVFPFPSPSENRETSFVRVNANPCARKAHSLRQLSLLTKFLGIIGSLHYDSRPASARLIACCTYANQSATRGRKPTDSAPAHI